MSLRIAISFLAVACWTTLAAGAESPRPELRWICSTETRPWQEMRAPFLVPVDQTGSTVLTVDSSHTYQKMIGFGGCFNELGWQALQAVDHSQRDEVMQALFSSTGCNFMTCRAAIGANDFALGWYSLDETPGDDAMVHFNIDEDRRMLLPFIKAAMAVQPRLAIWSVPWSPPSWMKTNREHRTWGYAWSLPSWISWGGYCGGRLKQDPETLGAYALYFSKYAQAYLREGIPLRAVMPQNEPAINDGVYPQCGWSGQELDTFLRDHLIPQLKKDHVPVEVWLGTLTSSRMSEDANPVLNDPRTNPNVSGVGYQYDGQAAMQATHEAYPDKLMLQTETECYHGDNLWSEGMETFDHMIADTVHFSNGYLYWNMVLNEKKTSSWGWRQNSLVVVNGQTKEVTFNPEFYAMKHFGNLIQPGALRVEVTAPSSLKATAVQNPSGEVVVLFSNDSSLTVPAALKMNQSMAHFDIPPHSMNSVILPNQKHSLTARAESTVSFH